MSQILYNDISNVCVVGGGNTGVALAVDISQRKNVTLLTSKADCMQRVLEKFDTDTNEIQYGKNIKITANFKEAYKNADMIVVTLPSFCIQKFAEEVSGFNPKIILFIPGFGGKEFYMQEMKNKGCIISGFDRSLYICRLETTVKVKASKKKSIRLACLGSENVKKLSEEIGKIMDVPCKPLKNYLTVTFTPSNPILHTARLYSMFKDADFSTKFPRMIKFYAEWTNESSDLLLNMDNELHKICNAITDFDLSGVIPLSIYYESDTVEKMSKKITTIKSWHEMNSPMVEIDGSFYIDSKSRYFKEDFPYGLFILLEFARIYAVDVPYMTKVYQWYRAISGEMNCEVELNLSREKIQEMYS